VTHAVEPPAPTRAEDLTRIVLRPLASPLPLGALALAMGSILLSALQLHWIDASNAQQVALVVLVFVVPLEVISAIMFFFVRDVTLATGFGLLTGSWAATGVLLESGQPGQRSQVLGLLALAVAVALIVPAACATWSKPAGALLMVVAAVRFGCTGIYELGAGPTWQTVAGIIGVVLVGTALYGAAAFALEDARHRPVLPVSRRSTGEAAMSGDLDRQLVDLPTEAGVRQES
jgi:uncharacterized protein